MATFGSTSETILSSSNIAAESGNGCILVSRLATLTEDGRVSSIQGFISGTNGESASIMYALYDSSRDFKCSTVSSEHSISMNEWVIRNLAEPFNLSAGDYWITAIGNGYELISGSSTATLTASNNTGGTGNSMSTNGIYMFTGKLGTSTNAFQYNIYATYTALVVWPRTDDATSIGGTSAILNGNLLKLSGGNATIRGFVYDTVSRVYPGEVATASSGYASVVSESGSFSTGAYSLNITGQTPGRIYYRAFAYDGTVYNYGYEKTVDINSIAWLTA